MKFKVEEKSNLVDFLLIKLGYSSKNKVKSVIKFQEVKVNGKIIKRGDIEVKGDDLIEVDFHKKSLFLGKVPFITLYEDEDLVAVDKIAGLSTVSITNKNEKSLYNILNQFYRENSKEKVRINIVHRLDKEVSGITLFAKSGKVQNLLKDNWQDHKKIYMAFVEGIPEIKQDTIKNYLKEGAKQKVYVTEDPRDAKLAICHYKVVKEYPSNALLEVTLETGRKNQIRVQLANMGHPIVGDRKYGADDEFIRRIRLHSHILEFTHPITGEKLKIESPLPKRFTNLSNEDEDYK